MIVFLCLSISYNEKAIGAEEREYNLNSRWFTHRVFICRFGGNLAQKTTYILDEFKYDDQNSLIETLEKEFHDELQKITPVRSNLGSAHVHMRSLLAGINLDPDPLDSECLATYKKIIGMTRDARLSALRNTQAFNDIMVQNGIRPHVSGEYDFDISELSIKYREAPAVILDSNKSDKLSQWASMLVEAAKEAKNNHQ